MINGIVYAGQDIFDSKFDKPLLQEKHVICCNTPFSDASMVKKYEDKFVLVSGLGQMIEITEKYGYTKAIDIEEFYALFP